MQITIGEYTTRNGCRAIVGFKDIYSGIELLRGFVILPGGLTKVCVWWDLDGRVRFPAGYWHYRDSEWGFVDKENRFPHLIYSEVSHAMLDSTPSPFDITGPKQMKEETKPTIVQKQRLIKLPDGSWVDPTTVAAITIIPPSVLDPESLRYWIAVIRTSITEININCDSREQAQRLADDLAEKVNSIK